MQKITQNTIFQSHKRAIQGLKKVRFLDRKKVDILRFSRSPLLGSFEPDQHFLTPSLS